MSWRNRSVLAMFLALVLSACGGSGGNPTGPSGGSGSSGSGGSGGSGGPTTPGVSTISATIDGTPWTSSTAGGFLRNGILSLAGSTLNGTTTTTFSFATSGAVGTSSVGPGSGTNSTYLVVNGAAAQGWMAAVTVGSGTVTVETLTATGASGSFSFALEPANGGATGVKRFSNGRFTLFF